MKTPNFIKMLMVSLVLGMASGCGAEAVVFIPLFSATWPDVNDPDHQIVLRQDSENTNVSSGIFAGFELHDSDFEKNDKLLSGRFNGYDIEFIIQRETDVKFKGKFITDDNENIIRIELVSTDGEQLILGF
ncbi:hypothetical protein GCM10028791_33170 [Echinicola sediminis]